MNFRIIQRIQRLMCSSNLLSNEHLLDGTPMTFWRFLGKPNFENQPDTVHSDLFPAPIRSFFIGNEISVGMNVKSMHCCFKPETHQKTACVQCSIRLPEIACKHSDCRDDTCLCSILLFEQRPEQADL